MYADRVVSGSKRSVKDRLHGNTDHSDFRSTITTTSGSAANKRQRHNDDKWKHDLYDTSKESTSNVGGRDLRFNLDKRALARSYQNVKPDLRKKLSLSDDTPQLKEVVIATKTAPLPPPNKLATTAAARKKSHHKQQAESSVDPLLQSLGLEKYSIILQAEEIDMTALRHMNDEDLKALNIPMGPRKKILLALEDSRG